MYSAQKSVVHILSLQEADGKIWLRSTPNKLVIPQKDDILIQKARLKYQ
jgi:hypothetical protein